MFKKLVAITVFSTVLFACKNSESTQVVDVENENSINWVGEYEGVLPCASCPGIEYEVCLNEDNTFEMEQEYLGQDKETKIETKGKIVWSDDRSVVTLNDVKFKVLENQLVMLNDEGNEAEGETKDAYVLKKQK